MKLLIIDNYDSFTFNLKHMCEPHVEHVIALNRLLRFIRKLVQDGKHLIIYRKLASPVKLVVVADSAFMAKDYEGLALRGFFLLLVSGDPDHPGGFVQIIDWLCRKQNHVCMSLHACAHLEFAHTYEYKRACGFVHAYSSHMLTVGHLNFVVR